jgi:hypothetical protein
MANYKLRNTQLLSRMQAHPLKASLAKALDIAEAFAGDVEFLSLDKNLSDAGRQNARQAKLRAAVRDLRDARAPVAKLEQKLAEKRAAIAMPPFKQDDVVGFLRRQELRAILRATDPGQTFTHDVTDIGRGWPNQGDPPSRAGLNEFLHPLRAGARFAGASSGHEKPAICRTVAGEARRRQLFGPRLGAPPAIGERIGKRTGQTTQRHRHPRSLVNARSPWQPLAPVRFLRPGCGSATTTAPRASGNGARARSMVAWTRAKAGLSVRMETFPLMLIVDRASSPISPVTLAIASKVFVSCPATKAAPRASPASLIAASWPTSTVRQRRR